jgi:hypothetical protein
MKTLRTLCAACVLALAFAMPAFAGYISADVAGPPPPPPPPATATGTASADGHITIGLTSTDSVTEAALTLVQIVLSLP